MAVRIVLMGVSGCGKSTVGPVVASALGVPYLDGDALHPPANIQKMAQGISLVDADRIPWLTDVAEHLAAGSEGAVVGCSALTRRYRDIIRSRVPDAVFAHLHGSEDVLRARLGAREDHFMPASLLGSQLATLEPLGDDEAGAVFDIELPAAEIARRVVKWVA